MKTHEFAESLIIFAKILKSSPNVEITDEISVKARRTEEYVDDNLSVNLHSLAMLSKVDKKQWIELINNNEFPIQIRERDASRDIIGKLLRYLDANPNAIEKLRKSVDRKNSRTSEALDRALKLLIPERRE